jgi:hypothetical protein
MIDKLIRKLGYIKKEDLTEEYLCHELAKIVGDPTQSSVESDQEKKIYADLARIHGILDYLRDVMAKDMQRDFSAPVDQKQLIRGAFARTAYIKGKIVEINKSLT